MYGKAGACLLLLLVSAAVVAAPLKRDHQVFYQISGVTVQELRQQMNLLGPLDHGVRYDASTAWNIQWRYSYEQGQQGCKMTGVHVTLDTTYSFPEWKNYMEADSKLKGKWDQYLIHLHNHENVHAANGDEAARDIDYLLNSFPAMNSCQALESYANQRAQLIISLTNKRDMEYDINTRHGVAQGAIF